MVGAPHPALAAFVAQFRDEYVVAQVLIRQWEQGYELRHVEDRQLAADQLRTIPLSEARSLARFTAKGGFRPLRSAPNLQSGWRLAARGDPELEMALNQFYPDAIADWFAARSEHPPVTNYREFTDRQAGMYRITTLLNDRQAARAIRACCDRRFCLKQRLWTIQGLAKDRAEEKSLLRCLEPCAIMLEVARKTMRIEQQEKMRVELAPDEVRTIVAALQTALSHPDANAHEADFNAPGNPRRLKLVLKKFEPVLALGAGSTEEQE